MANGSTKVATFNSLRGQIDWFFSLMGLSDAGQ